MLDISVLENNPFNALTTVEGELKNFGNVSKMLGTWVVPPLWKAFGGDSRSSRVAATIDLIPSTEGGTLDNQFVSALQYKTQLVDAAVKSGMWVYNAATDVISWLGER
jgi:hypothetical protein